jgi:hypothetical protein
MANFRGGQKSSEPYQELDEVRGAELNRVINTTVRNNMPSEIGLDRSLELTSVAVVPDGMTFIFIISPPQISHLIKVFQLAILQMYMARGGIKIICLF